jgi:hypothetical protein
MNHDERGPWYLLTGLLIGIALGLVYAWLVQPIKYIDTAPASLRSDFKDQYRALIAAAYLGNNDLVRARARLELIHDADVFRAISAQAQHMLAENGTSSEARALGLLAIALGQAPPGPAIAITQQRSVVLLASPPPTQTFSATDTPVFKIITEQIVDTPSLQTTTAVTPPATDTPVPTSTTSPTPAKTPTPTDTPRPRPTLTPTRTPKPTDTPGGPFLLLSKDKDCEQQYDQPQVQIEALDRFNQPVSGVLVIVNWRDSEERFFTGLKPEKGLGYADYTLTPGVLYTLRLGENGMPVLDLAALECNRQGQGRYWGAWVIKFVQP